VICSLDQFSIKPPQLLNPPNQSSRRGVVPGSVPHHTRRGARTREGTTIEPTQVDPATDKFDRLFDEAVPLISSQRHRRDSPPVEGGRWPVSVVLRPPDDSELSRRLDALTSEAAVLAGPGHWLTGRAGSAHLTVRALETYRQVVDPSAPVIQRYRAALRAAADRTGPALIQVTGLTLTAGSVMACAFPLDAQADLLMDRFAEELGPDGLFEHPHGRRDIWYLNLVHFTSHIPSPQRLIDWVAERRRLDVGRTTITTTELVRFHYSPDISGPFMRPQLLDSVKLLGSS
jgi:hypothetical protein